MDYQKQKNGFDSSKGRHNYGSLPSVCEYQHLNREVMYAKPYTTSCIEEWAEEVLVLAPWHILWTMFAPNVGQHWLVNIAPNVGQHWEQTLCWILSCSSLKQARPEFCLVKRTAKLPVVEDLNFELFPKFCSRWDYFLGLLLKTASRIVVGLLELHPPGWNIRLQPGFPSTI